MTSKRNAVSAFLLATLVAACGGDGAADGSSPLTIYGNVDIREVNLAFRVSGRLAAALVDEGEVVAAGDPVARLDSAPYEKALEAAEARVARADAALRKLQNGSRPEELDAARAAVADARAALDIAERNLERKRVMAADEAASERELDEAEATRERAAAGLDSARAALSLVEEGPRSEDITAAQAELAAAIAERDRLAIELEDTSLAAPGGGVILTRAREPGAMLAAGEPVFILSLDERVDVRAYVPGPDLGRVAPGTPVSITTDVNDRRYRGRVGFVSPRAEFTPKTVETPELRTDLVYRLRIAVEDPDDALRQGMPVTVAVGAP